MNPLQLCVCLAVLHFATCRWVHEDVSGVPFLAMKSNGSLVYAVNTYFAVLEVDTAGRVRELGRAKLITGKAVVGTSVHVHGGKAYVAAGHSVVAFDVSDPSTPKRLWDMSVGFEVYDACPHKGYLYVARDRPGLLESVCEVFDMTTRELAGWMTSCYRITCQESTQRVYKTHGSYLYLLDTRLPTQPRSDYAANYYRPYGPISLSETGVAFFPLLSGAWVVYEHPYRIRFRKLKLNHTHYQAACLLVDGNDVLAWTGWRDTVDIGFEDSYNLGLPEVGEVRGMALAGDSRRVVAASDEGLFTFSWVKPATFTGFAKVAWGYTTGSSPHMWLPGAGSDIACTTSCSFTDSLCNVTMFKLHTTPVRSVGRLTSRSDGPNHPMGQVSGERLYLVTESEASQRGVDVYDISLPDTPLLLKTIPTSGLTAMIPLQGGLFVWTTSSAVLVQSVQDGDPVVATAPIWRMRDVRLSHGRDLLVVLSLSGGGRLLLLSLPTLEEVGRHPFTCSDCALEVADGLAFVTSGGRLLVFDIRDTKQITQAGELPIPGSWEFAGAHQHHVFLRAVNKTKVVGVDVTDPTAPSVVQSEDFETARTSVAFHDGILYTTGPELGVGVWVYRPAPPATPPTTTPQPPTTPDVPVPTDCTKWPAQYYSFDGRCNNPRNPGQGSARSPFLRTAEGTHFGRVLDSRLPKVRVVSNAVLKPTGAEERNTRGLNTLATFFGQFVAHDITEVAVEEGASVALDLVASGEGGRYNLGSSIPKSVEVTQEGVQPHNVNVLTAYLDLSAVYGSDAKTAHALREHVGGLLKTSTTQLAKEGMRFRYRGRHFPLCHNCRNMSTVPPTLVEAFGMVPGVEPTVGEGGRRCSVAPCFTASPEVECDVNPEWTSGGRYRDAVHHPTRDWLPTKKQAPGVAVAGAGARGGEDEVFVAGDQRITDNANLMTVHAMFLRNHNNKARALAARNPALTDEEIFHEARRQNIHEYQSIVYNEWLPALLGELAPSSLGTYSEETDASISNLFATAAFRLHSLVPTNLELRYADGRVQSPENGFTRAPVPAHALGHGIPPTAPRNNELPGAGQLGAFFTARDVVAFAGGEDAIMKSNLMQKTEEHDRFVTESLRTLEVSFPCAAVAPGGRAGRMLVDVPSATMERGRQHGLPGYDAVRGAFHSSGSVYGEPGCTSSPDLPEDPLDCFRVVTGERGCQAPTAELLRGLYKKVERVDPWVGLVVEKRARTSALGTTHSRIIADQFRRLRDGDRLFYSHALQGDELAAVESVTLKRVIESTFNVDVQENAFFVPTDDYTTECDAQPTSTDQA